GRARRTRDLSRYTLDSRSKGFIAEFMQRVDAAGSPVPSDRLITLENAPEGVVCNICAGHKANEALARVLSILLSARYGTTVGIEVGAYRFLLRLPPSVGSAEVKAVLLDIDPAHIGGILRLALKRTALFKWKLVQVAKKFGAIDTDADYERISIQRLIALFDGTVIQAEAYRELLTGYMDVEGAEKILAQIRGGEVQLKMGKISLLGSEGLFSSRDMIPPPTADQAVIGVLKRRLDQDRIILFCMNCRQWKSKTRVSAVPEQPQCPLCGARLIAALKPWEEEQIGMVSKKKKTEEERAVEIRLLRNANIVLSSGKKAVMALAAKGVGPEIASRILSTWTEGDAFYREILKAERNFIRTHRFWQ
ncbi:MAG TPA: DEAD/DEAH box helicase, partial [Methanomicrobiales archaeon]|nr:DEAD/DEAH box helicase [Methanomicrobiales archaeon]